MHYTQGSDSAPDRLAGVPGPQFVGVHASADRLRAVSEMSHYADSGSSSPTSVDIATALRVIARLSRRTMAMIASRLAIAVLATSPGGLPVLFFTFGSAPAFEQGSDAFDAASVDRPVQGAPCRQPHHFAFGSVPAPSRARMAARSFFSAASCRGAAAARAATTQCEGQGGKGLRQSAFSPLCNGNCRRHQPAGYLNVLQGAVRTHLRASRSPRLKVIASYTGGSSPARHPLRFQSAATARRGARRPPAVHIRGVDEPQVEYATRGRRLDVSRAGRPCGSTQEPAALAHPVRGEREIRGVGILRHPLAASSPRGRAPRSRRRSATRARR